MQNFVSVSSGLGGCGSKKLEIPSKYIRYILNKNWTYVVFSAQHICSGLLYVNKITHSEERAPNEGIQTALVMWMRCNSFRSYWVGSVCWSPDSLFLACVLKRGSLLMVSRLTGLLTLSSFGCSVDFGPAQFLPLHPLVTYRYIFDC